MHLCRWMSVISIVSIYLTNVLGQRSIIDSLYNYFSKTTMINGGNFIIQYPKRVGNVRKQKPFSPYMQFPCANTTSKGIGRSLYPPNSVHKLRPGDIDVIGAMGDSLIAGNGAMEEYALGTMIEYRGISWCAGGEGTWREYLTLPNILKEYNPNLTGYSTGTGEFLSEHSRLNVAYPVSADEDALRQAKILVKKMKSDPKIDIKNHWKMITIFFGANDICSAQCFDKDKGSATSHVRQLMYALDYLQSALPRTFVNLIPVLDVSVSLRVKRTMMCRFLHAFFCACFHHQGGNEMETVIRAARSYQYAEEQLVNSGRYDVKEDFTVVLQPFMKLFNAPNDPAHYYDEVIDISYITHDCFHFSQKGHALGANLLWNNLLEPVGRKSMKMVNYVMEKFNCPSKESPYLFTNRNSRNYLATGRQ
ncbi:phospholipase B1, membrane-associated-like [Harmonia axyridis]|uniref:phospholipase B1, membrane-associated-like n=1 Tax=Harmonia axyridis TaxID=115357 RepID=UPI001E2765BC|nr:phospholipase B1, membrane-associated-like [Harmonia axyridis]XP_045460805.1 phospholipase B1, membrane-associated-like [Harmonia axyridis]XP_045460806.1 phospholipase B1, membrane-associated-like [Harmonia axyridis]